MEKSIDYQQIRSYLEYAPTKNFSAFVEVPFTFLRPEVNAEAEGIGPTDEINYTAQANAQQK